MFCAAKSTWSYVLRVCAFFLVLGLLYQTWALHTHFSTRLKLEKLRFLIATRLERLTAGFDQHAVFDVHHLDLGPSVSLANYTALLEKATRDAFSSTTSSRLPLKLQQVVASARSAVELAPKGGWFLQEIPATISTTIRNTSEMPEEFHGWAQRNPGWKINVFDNDAQDRWLMDLLAIPTESGLEKTVVLNAYEGLPRRILKSDMFRYLMIFLEGGVYADSDTSSVVPVAKWGQKGTLQDWTDPILLQLAAEAQALTYGDSRQPPPPPVNEAPPALVISLETATRRDDAEGGHLAQYAFASAPGHPMLLDLLQHIVEVSRAVEDLRAAGDNRTWNTDQLVFTWTGPEVWSSAVWRYLWARWGFDSRRLDQVNHPVRVGDVLILPVDAFRAPTPEPSQDQPIEACLWHGFNGHSRWRHSGKQ